MGGVLPSLQSVSDTDRNAFLTVLVIPSTVIYLVMPLSYLVWFLLKYKLKWRLNMSVLSYFKMKPCRAISTIDSPKLDQYRRRDFRTFWFQICWLGIKKVDGCAERHLCGIDSLSLSSFLFLEVWFSLTGHARSLPFSLRQWRERRRCSLKIYFDDGTHGTPFSRNGDAQNKSTLRKISLLPSQESHPHWKKD